MQRIPRLNIAARDFRGFQSNESVQLLLLAGHFCTTNCISVMTREGSQKNTLFSQYPVSQVCKQRFPESRFHLEIIRHQRANRVVRNMDREEKSVFLTVIKEFEMWR